MAEIHVLSIRSQDPDQVARLHSDLATAYKCGSNLGSRAPHIQVGGENLQRMANQLEAALNELLPSLRKFDLQYHHAEEMLQRLLGQVQRLADSARQYPKGS